MHDPVFNSFPSSGLGTHVLQSFRLAVAQEAGSFQDRVSKPEIGNQNKKSPPVFDGDPKGEINGYTRIEWSRQRYPFDSGPDDDMVDLPNRYEIALGLERKCPESVATADITPRRLQKFRPVSGETCRWENRRLSTGETIRSETITADSYGFLTIPGFVVEKTKLGNKLILMR